MKKKKYKGLSADIEVKDIDDLKPQEDTKHEDENNEKEEDI